MDRASFMEKAVALLLGKKNEQRPVRPKYAYEDGEVVIHRFMARKKPFERKVQTRRALLIPPGKYTAKKVRQLTAARGISPKSVRRAKARGAG